MRMVNDDLETKRIKKQKRFKVLTPDIQKIWKSIAENYDLIEGAQLSNSFIILMTLDKVEDYSSLGCIYKPASTLKDSLENRLKREGYVDGIVENNKTYYKITSKGKKLLKGWISFLSTYT